LRRDERHIWLACRRERIKRQGMDFPEGERTENGTSLSTGYTQEEKRKNLPPHITTAGKKRNKGTSYTSERKGEVPLLAATTQGGGKKVFE